MLFFIFILEKPSTSFPLEKIGFPLNKSRVVIKVYKIIIGNIKSNNEWPMHINYNIGVK